MKRSHILTALPALALMAAAACTTSPQQDSEAEAENWRTDARLGEQVDRICFASAVDDFQMTTRRSVVVERGVNDHYLIETMGNCQDLRNALSMSFDTFPGSSCISKGDSIYAYDSLFGPDRMDIPPIRCPIKAIYKWEEDAIDQEADMDGEE